VLLIRSFDTLRKNKVPGSASTSTLSMTEDSSNDVSIVKYICRITNGDNVGCNTIVKHTFVFSTGPQCQPAVVDTVILYRQHFMFEMYEACLD
jgi:hypothetical protein